MEEILDLVDEHDTVIGTMPRTDVFAQGRTNFRLVSVFLRDSQGHFLIPRRTNHKSDYPNCFACVGGCVQSGETYDQACARELFEETGLLLDQALSYRVLGILNPWHHGIKGYNKVYEITVLQESITLNSDDFSEIIRVTPEQLPQQLTIQQVTHNFPILLKHFYDIILK